MKDYKLHTPDGVQDYLPQQLRFKTEIERRIEDVFLRYGYLPLSSPVLEYIEVFAGAGSVAPQEIYKFIDRDGSVLALRSDMTPAIARIAATSYNETDLPLRFSYVENLFRYSEDYQGKLREFTQAGVELIGICSEAADAEILAISAHSLMAAGLDYFRLDIGHMQFWQGVLEESGLDEACCTELKAAISQRDFVLARQLVSDKDIPTGVRSIIEELPFFMGGEEVIIEAQRLVNNEKSSTALQSLRNIYAILKGYGVSNCISFDLSMMGYLDYYTGIIFRGYTHGSGQSVISGGRYDSLIKHFERDLPAVGFATKLSVLMSALEGTSQPQGLYPETLLAYSEGGRDIALSVGSELRAAGLRIENSLICGNLNEQKEYARNRGISGILYFTDGENVTIADLNEDTENTCTIAALLEGAGKP